MERNTFPDIPNEINLYNGLDIQRLHSILQSQEIILDIGCGHGDFLIEQTVKFPSKYFIGIEISRKRAFKTSARLWKRNIRNFAVIDGEGETAIKLLFPENSVDEIHINFPDPWLRKRQWKNRIFKPSFLIQIIRVLKPCGRLDFVTDVAEYAQHVCGILKEFPHLKNNQENWIEKNKYERFPTLFYRKMSPLRDINYISVSKEQQLLSGFF